MSANRSESKRSAVESMPCYAPKLVYRSKDGKNANGKWPITFSPRDGYTDLQLTIPCGQCIGCRLERSRQWAIRCVHESQLHEANSFLTLTYDQDHLPANGSLVKQHFQKFIKRLRRSIPDKIRYFHCGEYGELLGRPHYHAIIFGYDFPDKVQHSKENDHILYSSKHLATLWPFGQALIGDVTFESAAYVARYVIKKRTGKQAAEHYGEKIPPYVTMSRRPGIAADWLKQFKTDIYPEDHVVIRNGQICKPPKFYDKKLEQSSPEEYKKIRKTRHESAILRKDDNTPQRLQVKERLKLKQLEQLKRGYELT